MTVMRVQINSDRRPAGRTYGDVRRIRSEALCDGALLEAGVDSHAVAQETSVCDHDAVVDAKPFVGGKYAATPLAGHDAHHVLETLVAADASDDKHLFGSDVRHGTFGDFDEHRKDVLLEREAEIGGGYGVDGRVELCDARL